MWCWLGQLELEKPFQYDFLSQLSGTSVPLVALSTWHIIFQNLSKWTGLLTAWCSQSDCTFYMATGFQEGKETLSNQLRPLPGTGLIAGQHVGCVKLWPYLENIVCRIIKLKINSEFLKWPVRHSVIWPNPASPPTSSPTFPFVPFSFATMASLQGFEYATLIPTSDPFYVTSPLNVL